jgi:hypothetical protein
MKKIFLTLVIFTALFGSVATINAQTNFNSNVDFTGTDTTNPSPSYIESNQRQQGGIIVCDNPPKCDLDDLIATVNKIINFLVVIAASVVAMMFCYAGFIYLTAGGDTGKAKKAKEVFTSTAVGFVIILAGWLIIKFVLQGFEADKEFLDVLKDK